MRTAWTSIFDNGKWFFSSRTRQFHLRTISIRCERKNGTGTWPEIIIIKSFCESHINLRLNMMSKIHHQLPLIASARVMHFNWRSKKAKQCIKQYITVLFIQDLTILTPSLHFQSIKVSMEPDLELRFREKCHFYKKLIIIFRQTFKKNYLQSRNSMLKWNTAEKSHERNI